MAERIKPDTLRAAQSIMPLAIYTRAISICFNCDLFMII
jgi:hypothetical protein